jgi:hypothetical protein
MKQLRLWKESLKSERDQKAAHWDYAPKQNLALSETAPRPSEDWRPRLHSNSAPKSKNHHTEKQIDALLKQGLATIAKAARADGLAEDNLDKLRMAIIKDLTTSQARPNEQDNEFPEHQQAKEKPLALPRRASRSPDRSRAPYEVVDYQPLNGRTSRSPTRRKPVYAKDLSGRREGSPNGYRVDRHITLGGDHTRICAVNRFWRINKNPMTKRMILFNALFSGERIRNIEEPYAKTEEFAFFRDDALHPFYREPYEDDELTLWTRNTSGIVVLHSVLIPRHPTRFTHLHVFSCTTKDWLVPVIKEKIKANTIARYLAAKLRPFYSEGKGEIMCPVCISYIVAERFWPVRFTRKEFIAHFEEVHQAFEGTAYLGFATGYSTRMYEAQIIYSYCLANSHQNVAEDKSADPFSETEVSELEERSSHVDSTYGVFFVTLLKDLFERTGTISDSC